MAKKSGRKKVSLPEAPALPKWKIKESHIVLFLLILALSTRLPFLEYPPYVVFDETHFGKFVSGYFTGRFFFNLHPPLPTFLIYMPAAIEGFRPGFDFAFAAKYPDDIPLFALRIMPAIVGSLLVPLVYVLGRQLSLSRKAAFLAGMMILFDNGSVSISRFILIDIFIPFFSLLALCLYFAGKRYDGWKSWLFLAGAAASAGAAVSSKWSGLAVVAFLILLELIQNRKCIMVTKAKRLAVLLLVPAVVYTALFAVHLALLYRSGEGDPFMSEGFKRTLEGSLARNDATPLGMAEKIVEHQIAMWNGHLGIKDSHPYASRFYTWPIMYRPIYMWANNGAHIYMLGNPAVWWLALVCLIAAFSFLNPVLNSDKAVKERKNAILIMLAFYLVNFLPFILINRVAFIYHYFTPFIISIIVAAMVLDNILFSGKNRYGFAIYVAIIVIIAITFLYFSPLTYGFPLTNDELNARMWLPSWR